MAQFLMLIRNEEADFSKYSPSDFQEILGKFQAFTQKLKKEGRFISGEKLTNDRGKTLRRKQEEIVVDGPYADTKEAVCGYYLIESRDFAEALEIGKGCPSLIYGGSLEIREIEQM